MAAVREIWSGRETKADFPAIRASYFKSRDDAVLDAEEAQPVGHVLGRSAKRIPISRSRAGQGGLW